MPLEVHLDRYRLLFFFLQHAPLRCCEHSSGFYFAQLFMGMRDRMFSLITEVVYYGKKRWMITSSAFFTRSNLLALGLDHFQSSATSWPKKRETIKNDASNKEPERAPKLSLRFKSTRFRRARDKKTKTGHLICLGAGMSCPSGQSAYLSCNQVTLGYSQMIRLHLDMTKTTHHHDAPRMAQEIEIKTFLC